MSLSICCEFNAPVKVGDAAAVIVVRSGSPDYVSSIMIAVEGCGCGYDDSYSDLYCDITESGLYPYASASDIIYTIDNMPPNSILTIDSAEHRVTLTDLNGRVQVPDISILDWDGLFEWVEATKGACQSVCFVTDFDSVLNADTTAEVTVLEREI